MPGEHAYFAPSASSRWLVCEASQIHVPAEGEETKSPYAHEGIVCHEVAAKCLKENLSAEDFQGQTIQGVFMDAELVEAMQVYIDEVRGQTKELGVKGGKIEHVVHVTEDCWGTADAIMWNDDLLIVDDLKMGKGVIVEANTPQLKIYAIGALKWLQQEYGLTPPNVRCIITQPRTMNPLRKQEYTRTELIEWYKDVLMPAMKRIHDGSAVYTPGLTQCRWCRIKGSCTAHAEMAINEAKQAFEPYTEREKPVMPDPKTNPVLDLPAMAALKKSFPFISSWMDGIAEHVLAEALAGTTIPGFKLVEGRSNRIWAPDDDKVETLIVGLGLKAFKETLKTAPAIEKEIGKKKAKEIKLDRYITKPKGKPTLVDASDKRPEMALNVEQEFKEFVEPKIDVEVAFDKIVTEAGSGPIIVETEDEFGDEPKGMTLMQKLAMGDIEDAPEVEGTEELSIEPKEEVEVANMFSEFADVPRNVDGTAKQMNVMPSVNSPEYLAAQKNIQESFGGEETATGGDPTGSEPSEPPEHPDGIIQYAAATNPVEPKKSTKRHAVLNMGRGGVSLEDVAKALNCGVNSVKMHIRYLHERDGYGYELYSDGTFKILE